MRSLTLRRTAVAALVPLGLGSLAACGNHDSSTAADPHAGPSSSAASPSSPATDSGSRAKGVDPAAFVEKLKTAASSITTARFTMDMELAGQSVRATGAIDMTGDKPAMELKTDLTGMGTPTDMRLVGGFMYIESPSAPGKYVKMDLSDPSGPFAGMGDALTNYDPESVIASMSPDSFRTVTDLGQDSVGGQQAEHYHVVIDTTAATKAFQNLPSTASLPKTMAYDLWLDGRDRISKFRLVMKKVSTVTATYRDYGADVSITAPDPSDIVTMPGSTTG
jgi:hypothetical protein